MRQITTDLLANTGNQNDVEGTAYISELTEGTTKNGKTYKMGMLVTKEERIPLKIWDINECIYAPDGIEGKLKDKPFESGVYHVKGSVNLYNNEYGVFVDYLEKIDEPLSNYIASPYNIKELQGNLVDLFKNEMTPEACKLFKKMMCGKDFDAEKDNFRLYQLSVAAKSHHDAFISGLFAHSLKVTRIALNLISYYPAMKEKINKDILVLGCLLHDVAKIMEYKDLGISEIGKYCSHLSLGVEFLSKYKENIVDFAGTEGYYRLQSMITQHHGEFGDRPRTVEAYIVHQADLIESRLEAVEEEVQKGTEQVGVRDGNEFYRLV